MEDPSCGAHQNWAAGGEGQQSAVSPIGVDLIYSMLEGP